MPSPIRQRHRAVCHCNGVRLAAERCTIAIGPVDGNTWQRYRLITEPGTEPPFFLEPDNPDAWPGQFTAAGFTPLAQVLFRSQHRPDG